VFDEPKPKAVAGAAAPVANGRELPPDHGRNPFFFSMARPPGARATRRHFDGSRRNATGPARHGTIPVIVPIEIGLAGAWPCRLAMPENEERNRNRRSTPRACPDLPSDRQSSRRPSHAARLRASQPLPHSRSAWRSFRPKPWCGSNEVLGDIRELMSWLALATQGLVVIAMLAGVMGDPDLAPPAIRRAARARGRRGSTSSCVSGTQIAVIAVAGALIGVA